MTRLHLQACVVAVAVLALRGAAGQRELMLDGEADAGERTVSRSMAVMGSGELGGGLTVQDPPAGWPLSELRAMDRQHAEPRPRVSRWSAPMSSSSSWSAVEEPDAAASESRGSIRYYSSTPAPDNGGPVPAGGDQQQMAGQPAAWYADGPHNLGPDVPRQGRVLSAHPSDLNQPSAPPPAGGAAAAAPEHSMTYFTTTQDAEPAAGNDSPMASWQPTNSRYKRKRKGPKQQLQQQQPDQDQVLHQQKQQQDLLQQQQQQQQLLEQQHQQLEQQIQDEQLQHEAPPVEAKKNKKTLKRVNKRRPVTPPQQSQSQPQHQVLAPAPQAGPDPTVSVGYSIGFAAPDAGLEHRQVPVDHHPQQQQQLQQHGEYTPHRGTVQSEVVHGEGAVSYSNTLLPIPQDGGLHQHQQYQEQYLPGTVSSPVINGRPIYVAPIQQAAPAPTPAFHQLALPLPTPQALVGGPGPQITFNSVSAAPSVSVQPTSAPVVVSTTPSYVVRTPHTIFTSGSSTQSEFALGPNGPPSPSRKPPKAASAVLHINDGTDFAWQDVGNGVEVSAPITPNGLRGGYRDSIPIMEDTDDDSEPPVPFEASTAAGLHSGPPPPNPGHSFDNSFAITNHAITSGGLSSNALFDHTTAVFAGGPDSGHVEAATNQLLADDGPSSPTPQEKPDPFRGFTSSSFIDFMRAYSSTGRHPHSGGGPAGGGRPPFGPPADAAHLGSKLVQGQVYYIPSETPGGEPVPAVIMPLSRLRELHAALPSAKKPVYDLPPSSSASEGGAEAPFKSSIFSESPFKSSVFSDSPFKSSFADGPFKSPSFSDAPFKTSESPFSSPDAPFKGPSFGGGPPPSKYRPSAPFGKGPKDGFFKAGGGPSSVFPRPHHAGGFPPKPHSLRFGGGGGGGTGGSSVKITKSVPVYEEHSKLNPQGQQSAAAAATANEPSPALQWPPKETVDVQTYLMPIEQFDSLQSSGPPGPQSPSHHGPPRGPPRGPPPPHHREVRRPVGPHPHRPVRAHQGHSGHPGHPGHPGHHHQQHQQHGQLEPGAFAVSSSYRVRPSNG